MIQVQMAATAPRNPQDLDDSDVRQQQQQQLPPLSPTSAPHEQSHPATLLQEDDPNDDGGSESALGWGGRHLQLWCGQRITRRIQTEDCSASNARRRIQAAAEFVASAQSKVQDQLLQLVIRMKSAQHWRPIHYCEHALFDETPLNIVVQYQGDDGKDGQVAKTFVVESEWAMLIELLPSPLSSSTSSATPTLFTLRGRSSPAVRALAATDGETICEALRTVAPPPSGISDVFPICTRFSEADEHPANPRAETLLSRIGRQGWAQMHSVCFAHKLHSAASKTWALPMEAGTISSVIHTGKFLTTGGSMKKLKDNIKALVSQRFQLLAAFPPDDGVRAAISKYFIPSVQQPRKRAFVLATLEFFNGAWGKPKVLQHVCKGCCQNREMGLATATSLLHRLVTSIFGRVLSRANWSQWSESLQWFAFASGLHGLVTDAFAQAFQKESFTAVMGNDSVVDVELFPDLVNSSATAGTPTGQHGRTDPEANAEDDTSRQR